MHRNMLIVVSGVVVTLLLGFVGFLLFRGINRLSDTRKKLEKSMTELSDYYRKDPFPSEENVAREKENVETLRNWSGELLKNLREGQIEPKEDQNAMAFMDLLKNGRVMLKKSADSSGTVLPKDFAFGFDRFFATGEPPMARDVPRLIQQLTVIEELCKVFFEERVKEIVTISRSEFEGKESHDASDIKSADTGGMGDLYTKMHFVFGFNAKESSLRGVLNRVTGHKIFIVPTLLQFGKKDSDVRSAPEPKGEGSSESTEKVGKGFDDFQLRRKRVVCGREFETPMMVKLEVDVYTFSGE